MAEIQKKFSGNPAPKTNGTTMRYHFTHIKMAPSQKQ